VTRFFTKLTERGGAGASASIRTFNNDPALVIELADAKPRVAKRIVIRLELDAAGMIAELHVILAGRKLARL
jgi:hypothetical protein